MQHRYSDAIHSVKVAVLGPLPPPFGGVAVHVRRVIAKLQNQGCVVFHLNTCVEYRYRFFYFYLIRVLFFLMLHRPDQVHLHTLYLSNGLQELAWLVWLQKFLPYSVTLIEHDCRYLYGTTIAWRNRLNQLIPNVALHVYIGDRTAASFTDNAIVPAQKTSVEAAFIPPNTIAEKGITQSYPLPLWDFLDRHETILLANAFSLSLLDGKDLYGFDLCIKALHYLRQQGVRVGLVFVLAQIGDEIYFNICMRSIDQLGLSTCVFILTGQYELWPLMRFADFFVRPTLSDGASVSVQEALWCAKPVVASDVCVRPDGVMLFKTGDADDFQRVLLLAIAQSSVVPQGNQEIDNVCNQRCNDTSVQAAHRDQ